MILMPVLRGVGRLPCDSGFGSFGAGPVSRGAEKPLLSGETFVLCPYYFYIVHARPNIPGEIPGTVTEASRAVIPGATATIKDLAQGWKPALTTNPVGGSLGPNLLSGNSSIRAGATGLTIAVRFPYPVGACPNLEASTSFSCRAAGSQPLWCPEGTGRSKRPKRL